MRQSIGGGGTEEEAVTDVKELAEVKKLFLQLDDLRDDVEESEHQAEEQRVSTKNSLAKIKSLIIEADEINSSEDLTSPSPYRKNVTRPKVFDFSTPKAK